jgi:hypothetical protein
MYDLVLDRDLHVIFIYFDDDEIKDLVGDALDELVYFGGAYRGLHDFIMDGGYFINGSNVLFFLELEMVVTFGISQLPLDQLIYN